MSALKKLVHHLLCPNCNTQTLTVDVVDKGHGPVLGLCTECTECLEVCDETLSSERMGNRSSRSPFVTTRRMVAGTMDSGVRFKANVHTPLSAAVAGFVHPLYQRLGDGSLMRRCLRGKTQNSNESLHDSIWRKCPKTDFCGKLTLVLQ